MIQYIVARSRMRRHCNVWLRRYDASAHMTEETERADLLAPLGMLTAVFLAFVVGWCVFAPSSATLMCLADGCHSGR